MTVIDQRILRVTIEINGEAKTYEGPLNIHVSGTKFANAQQNTATIRIANLSRDVRNYLLTETSPFNKNRTPKRVMIEAGRVSTGVSTVFTGEIIAAGPKAHPQKGGDKADTKRVGSIGGKSSAISAPPDIVLELKAQTGAFQKGNLVARSGRATEQLSSIAKKVSDDLGTSLVFEATDKTIANYSFSGAALKQIDALADTGNVDAYQDDDKLVVKDQQKPLTNRTKVINKDTGMIGLPEVTERGIKVRFLYDNDTELGGALDVKSELNPSLNGQYTIYKLDFELSTRETAFYYTAQATRNGG